MQLYRLNVSRTDAGKEIPFDRVYLAHGEARKAVKALFDYALVLPLAEGVREQLIAAYPDLHRTLPQNERPTSWEPIPGGQNNWEETLSPSRDWLLVVPILPRLARKAMPTYLVNRRWYAMRATQRARAKKSPLPALAYLQTPSENFRPVCVGCPRFTEHMQGLCALGEKVCYETLVLGDLPTTDATQGVPDYRDLEDGTEVSDDLS